MNRISKLAVRSTGAVALAILLTPSTFADSRPLAQTNQNESWRSGESRRSGDYDDRRDNRVTADDGYRDRGYDRYDRYGRYDRSLRGRVERVDFRRGFVVLREERSGRFVTASLRHVSGYGRGLGLDDLRRGDRVTFSGVWTRGDFFDVDRIEGVRTR